MGGDSSASSDIGKAISAALPNISGQFGFTVERGHASGAFSEFVARTLFGGIITSSKKSII